MNDLTPEALRPCLPAWVSGLDLHAETDSTNLEALRLAERGAPGGTLVVAEHQTAGRGRLERRWEAPPGTSLLFSLLLRPAWPAPDWALLNLAAAAAVCRCLAGHRVQATVKWPNDVLVDGKKVCGILAESRGGAAALGVGLNVRQTGFPPGLRHPATSLEAATGVRFDRSELLCALLGRLGPLLDGPADGVVPAYRPWCETLGRLVRVELEGAVVEEVAVDLEPAGALVLASGLVVTAGDVMQLR